MSSSVIPYCSRLQSFPAERSFQMNQFFASGGQSIGVSASASVLPMSIEDRFPLGWDWLDILAVQGTLKSLLQHHSSKASILRRSAFFIVQLSFIHDYWKTIALTRRTFVGKVCLGFLICCLVCHSFSSKEQASFNFMAAVTICSNFAAQKDSQPLFPHLFPMKWWDQMPWT